MAIAIEKTIDALFLFEIIKIQSDKNKSNFDTFDPRNNPEAQSIIVQKLCTRFNIDFLAVDVSATLNLWNRY